MGELLGLDLAASDASDTGRELVLAARNACAHYWSLPASRSKPPLEEEFRNLAERWREETRFLSAAHDRFEHWAYQRIIGLGPDALGLVLGELEQNGGHWYWALRALTGIDPVSEEQRGDIQAMREAWLKWARETGRLR